MERDHDHGLGRGGRAPAKRQDDNGSNDDGGGNRKPRRQAARVASPRGQASDQRPGFRLSRRLGPGDRVDPGDGLVLVTGAAIGPGQGGKDPAS
jgi:hypothetical protein